MFADIDSATEVFLDAAYSSDFDVIIALLNQGLPVDVFDGDYITALQIAAATGNLELIHLLIKRGADVDKCNDTGFTPLLHACRNGHLKAVQLLLENGADSRRCTFYGTNAITLASAGGHRDIVIYLQGMCEMPQVSAPSPLIVAVARRRFDLVAFFRLLRNGALWHSQSGLYGINAYQIAEIYRDREMMNFLFGLDNYLDFVRHCDRSWRRTERNLLLPDIRCLIHDRKINQLQRLLESGREYVPLPDGVTPLMFAAVIGDLDMIKMLVMRCGNVDASFDGFSALTIAMVCGNDSAVKFFCEIERQSNSIYGTVRKKVPKQLNGSISARSLETIAIDTKVRKMHYNFFKKCKKLFQRRKLQRIESTAAPSNSRYGNRLAFRKRVVNTIGSSAARIPDAVYDCLKCLHDAQDDNCFTLAETNMTSAEETNILKTLRLFGVKELRDLFRRVDDKDAYLPFYSSKPLDPNGDRPAWLFSPVKPSNSSTVRKPVLNIIPHIDSVFLAPKNHLDRNVSNLRRRMFQFKSSSIQPTRVAVSNSIEDHLSRCADFWTRISDACGSETCKILKDEGVDFESFLLLNHEDFEGMFSSEDRIDVLERIQEFFNKGRVVYL